MKNYLQSVQFGNGFLVFNQFAPKPVYLEKEELLKLMSGGENSLPKDVRDKLLESSCTLSLPKNFFEKRCSIIKKDSEVLKIIYLSTTLNCNSNCQFCIVPTRDQSIREKRLDISSVKSGLLSIENFCSLTNEDSPISLIFYGGEPLLNKQVIRETLDFLAGQQSDFFRRLKPYLCTNGYLLNEDEVSFLANNAIPVTVAWEPLERIHSNYRGNYALVKEKILRLMEAGVETSLSVAMVPEVIDHIDELIFNIENLGIKKYGFNLIRGSYLTKRDIDIGLYAKKLSDNLAKNLDSLIGSEYQTTKRYNAITEGRPLSIDCSCYGNQFVIFPDATIGNCPFETHGQAAVGTNDLASIKARWSSHLLSNETLSNFGFGGGCYWGAKESGSSCDLVTKEFNSNICNELIKFFYLKNQKVC